MRHRYAPECVDSKVAVEVSGRLNLDEVWQLYLETSFLYPEKLAALAPDLPAIVATIERLITAPNGLMETVVARHEGILAGHLCALRAYRKTWVVQHLAALRRIGSSADLNITIARLFLIRTDIEWIRMAFRPDNPLPMRVFGSFAQQVDDGTSSSLRTMSYWTTEERCDGNAKPVTGLEVHSPRAADAAAIRQWFTDRERLAEYGALDLEADPRLEAAGEAFGSVQLIRRREILVARRLDKFAGFALCEVSSRGMNLSELTNAMTLHVSEGDREAADTLLQAGRSVYERAGMRRLIVLDDGANEASLRAAGLRTNRSYVCWALHRRHAAGVVEHFERLFARVRR